MKPLSSEEINNLKSDKGLASVQVPTSENIEENPLAYSGLNKDAIARTPKSIDSETYNEYLDYDIHLNVNSDLKEADKQRAKNQGFIEQVGRGVGQVVANEIVLGSLKGFSDIFDSVYNVIANEGYNDYTNPVSEALENAQNSIRERLEVYEQDPNSTFNFKDSGWWINGLTTIASTLSLAIPARGITGAAGALGKLTKLNKGLKYATRGKYGIGAALSKLPKNTKFTTNPILNGAIIEKYGRLGADALLMRTAENYQEARGVYQEVYDSAKERWADMDEKQKQDILSRRPDWQGLTDDEVAQAIASESASETFTNDMWLLALDAFQLKSLTNLYRGVGKTAASSALRAKNLSSIANLTADGAKEASKKYGKLWQIGQSLKKLDSPLYAELSEGFEEGWQGIQTEKGKEYAEKIFDPKYKTRDLASYLSDSEIWEQAFWGYIGGIGFQAIGQGVSGAKNKIVNAWEKQQAKDKNDIVPEKLTYEKLREQEIEGREIKFNELLNDLNVLENNGRNPYAEKTVKDITNYKNQSSEIYGQLDPVADKAVIKEMLINDFVTDLTMSAVEIGNEELLTEYLKSPYLNRYINENFKDNEQLDKAILNRVEDVKNKYYNELWKVANTVKGDNENITAIIARERTRNRFRSEALRNAANDVGIEIDNVNTDNFDYIPQAQYDKVEQILEKVEQLDFNPTNKNITEKIAIQDSTDKSFNFYVEELKKIPQIAAQIAERTALGNEIKNNEIIDIAKEYLSNKVETREALNNLIARKNDLEIAAGLREALLNQTDAEIQDRYNEIGFTIDRAVKKQITNAYDKVKERMLNYSDKMTDDDILFDLRNNGGIFNNLQKEIETLNIGFHSGRTWHGMLEADLKSKRKTDEIIANTAEVNGEPVEAEKATIPEPAPEVIVEKTTNADETGDSSSTGEEIITDDSGQKVLADVAPIEIETPIEPSPTEAKVIEDIDAEYTAEFGETPTIYTIRSIVVHNYKKYKNIFDKLIKDGVNPKSEEYRFIREKLDNKIKDYNVDSDVYERVVNGAIEEALRFIEKNRNRTTFALTTSIDGIQDRKTIEDFLKEFVEKNNIPTNKKGKTYIDVDHIFANLLENKDISFDDARFIYMNLATYIENSKDSKFNSPYKFINSGNAYKGFANLRSLTAKLDRANKYLNELIENKTVYDNTGSNITVSASNDFRRLADAEKQTILSSLEDGDVIEPRVNGNSILLYKNKINTPIGLLSKVEVSNNGSTVRDYKTTGLSYTITKNNNGSYTSNFDEVFEAILTGSEAGVKKDGITLRELLYNYLANSTNGVTNPLKYGEVPTSVVADSVLNNSLIAKLIENGGIKFPTELGDNLNNKATYILDELGKLFTKDKNAFTIEDKRISLHNWINSVYNNYMETYDIQDAIETDKPIRFVIQNLDGGKAIISNKPKGIASRDLHFTATYNPMVAIIDGGTVQVEGRTETFPANGLRTGTIGLLIRDGEHPVYALSEPNFNLIDKSSKLADGLRQELTNILKDRLEGKNFDELVRKIKDLFGGKGKDYSHNNLFTGFDIVYGPTKSGNNAIALKKKGTNEYLFVAYRYRNGTTQNGTGITVYNKGVGISFSTFKDNEAAIANVVDNILSNTRFNRTYLAFRQFENGSKPTYYTTKNGNALSIDLGGVKLDYNSFTDFAIKNNIFNTYQGVDSGGNYFQRDGERFHIKIEKGSSPVEEHTQSIVVPLELFSNPNPNTAYDTDKVLKRLNVSDELIKQLRTNNLIPKEIYYRRTGPANARGAYNANNGRISVFNGFVSESNINPRRAVTILMHEQFHKYFEESGYRKRADITEELIDIYNEFVEKINAEPEKYKAIIEWIAKNNFTVDNYINNLPKKLRDSLNEQELRQLFAEEWLVESLSQQAILNAMNELKSTRGDNNIEGREKSLFQKLIDAVLKLFGINFDNVENNSILAREYKLLGNNIAELADTNDVTLVNKEEVAKEDVTEQSEEPIDIEEDTIEVATKENIEQQSEFDDDLDLFEIPTTKGAFTTEIDSDNTNSVNSIKSLIDTYDERERPGIANFVQNGGINFRC
jgi:hypothetical protein|nr:MAG TPA: hypothetical protein [Crassvirales sp.]